MGIRPRVHIFGHIHEDSGCTYDGQTLFINASSVDLTYKADQPCIVFDLPHDKSLPAQIVTPCSNLDGEGVITWLKQKVHEQRAKAQQVGNTKTSCRNYFEDIVPFFEKKSPLITGKELLSYTDNYTLACDLQ